MKYVARGGKWVPKEDAPPLDAPQVHRDAHGSTMQWVDHQLPLNWKYAPRHDKQGRAVFTSYREIKESVKRAQAHGEPVAFERPFKSF